MSRSIRGELTEQAEIHFSHPNSFLPPKLSSLTALGYAIASGNHEEIVAILKETKEFLLNEFDYSGNTPLVSGIFMINCLFRRMFSAVLSCFPAFMLSHAEKLVTRELLLCRLCLQIFRPLFGLLRFTMFCVMNPGYFFFSVVT